MARRIFISYHPDDVDQAKGFNLLQWNQNVDIEFVGRHLISPVDSDNDDYVRSKIREQIYGTSTTVVLIGDRTAESDWVDFEIRESLSRGHGVLGIRIKGDDNSTVPPALAEVGAKVIKWDPHSFSDEIEKTHLIASRPQLGPPSSLSTSAGCGR